MPKYYVPQLVKGVSHKLIKEVSQIGNRKFKS